MWYTLVEEHTWGVSGSTFMSLGGKTNKLHCPEHMKNTSSLPNLPGVQDKYKWSKKSIKQLWRNFLLPCSQNSMIATHYPIIDFFLNWKLFQLYRVTNLTNIAIMQFWWMYCEIHSSDHCLNIEFKKQKKWILIQQFCVPRNHFLGPTMYDETLIIQTRIQTIVYDDHQMAFDWKAILAPKSPFIPLFSGHLIKCFPCFPYKDTFFPLNPFSRKSTMTWKHKLHVNEESLLEMGTEF